MKTKRWRDVTPYEIAKLKKHHCIYCKYGSKSTDRKSLNPKTPLLERTGKVCKAWDDLTCNYILITGERRPCRPDECKLYLENRRL